MYRQNKYYQEIYKLAVEVGLLQLFQQAFDYLKPLDDITVAEWAALYRYVTKAESARSGKWDNAIAPFAVEIMNAATNPDVNEITMIGSAQVVKTEILKNIIAFFIAHNPQKMLLLEPTENVGRAFSIDKLKPMIDGNKCLRDKLYTENQKDNNTILHKIFAGGSLTIVGSNSPNSLAQRSVRLVLSDDIDRIPPSAGEEGDPVRLAEERTESFSLIGYKHIRFSTPTIKGSSRIERLYSLSDQREYYVPCPECNHKQTLTFDNITWEKEHDLVGSTTKHLPETAQYACANCGALISEKHKRWMITNGEWIAKYPERKDHRGYWINRLYSPFSSWGKIAKRFLEVKDNPDEYRVFYNTYLAKTWELQESQSIDEGGLLDRNEDYLTETNPDIPNDVLLLIASVDTQPDRLEVKIKGYGLNKNDDLQSYLIYYDQIWGPAAQTQVWDDLDHQLLQTYKRKDGIELKIKACFIDSGGHNTQDVYSFCQYRWKRNIFAVKGQAGFGKPMLLNKSIVGKKYGMTVTLINLGVDTIKETVYNRLNISDPNQPHYMHFTHRYCDHDYFKGLTAEKAVIKPTHTGKKIIWMKKAQHIRNEPWDLEIYATAAFYFVTKGKKNYLLKLKKKYDSMSKQKDSAPAEQEIEPVPAKKQYRMPRKKNNFINSWKRM